MDYVNLIPEEAEKFLEKFKEFPEFASTPIDCVQGGLDRFHEYVAELEEGSLEKDTLDNDDYEQLGGVRRFIAIDSYVMLDEDEKAEVLTELINGCSEDHPITLLSIKKDVDEWVKRQSELGKK